MPSEPAEFLFTYRELCTEILIAYRDCRRARARGDAQAAELAELKMNWFLEQLLLLLGSE